MLKASLSPSSPHSALFETNVTIQPMSTAHQTRLPTPDMMTYVFMAFCWGNGGRINASRKNQTAFTAHKKGSRAQPKRKYFLHSWYFSSSVTLGLVKSIEISESKIKKISRIVIFHFTSVYLQVCNRHTHLFGAVLLLNIVFKLESRR